MTHSLKIIGLLALTLVAITITGCSDDSSPVAVIPSEPVIDTAPPAIPTGLSAAATDNRVKIDWDENVLDADLYGFMVYRVVWGTRYPMLNLPQQETQWIDDHPVNVACTYVVTSLDQACNESAWAAVNFLGLDDEPELRMDF